MSANKFYEKKREDKSTNLLDRSFEAKVNSNRLNL